MKKNVQGFSESIRTGTGSVVQKFICPPDCFQVKSNFTSPWPRTFGRFTQFKPFNVTALRRANNCNNLMPHVAAKPVLGLVKIFILTWAGIEPEYPWKQTVTLPLSYSTPLSTYSWISLMAHSLVWFTTARFCRDDYLELCQLTVLYLGGKVSKFRFKRPGASHHTRFTSKALYTVKLVLLSK